MSHHDAFHDDGPPISQLQAAIKSLEGYVHAAIPPLRQSPQDAAGPPAAATTATATGGGRRRPSLTPVQHFGRQEIAAGRWKELARSHVAVCGLGGVGALAADALVRAGVGRVLLVDRERIRWSCMGEMGFYPEDVGFSRVQALRLRLQSIRAATATASSGGTNSTAHEAVTVGVDSFSVDWTSEADLLELRKKLKVSSVGGTNGRAAAMQPSNGDAKDGVVDDDDSRALADSGLGMGLFEALTQRRPYDAVLSCLEDDAERLALNQICLELSLPLLHVALSPCNTTIAIRTVLPGNSCCLECIERPPGSSESTTAGGVDHSPQQLPNAMDQVAKSIARAFPASLPHVELIAGGLLGQHAIKFLLEVGDFVPCFTVHAQTFEIESYAFPPNRACANATCRQRQEEEQTNAAMRF